MHDGITACAEAFDLGDEVGGELGGDEVGGGIELEDGLVPLAGLAEDEEVGLAEGLGELRAGLLEGFDCFAAIAFEGAAFKGAAGAVGEDVEALGW